MQIELVLLVVVDEDIVNEEAVKGLGNLNVAGAKPWHVMTKIAEPHP